MRISDCNASNIAVSIEKLHKYNEKLNNIVTFVEPTASKEGKLENVAVVLKDNVNTKGVFLVSSVDVDNFYSFCRVVGSVSLIRSV